MLIQHFANKSLKYFASLQSFALCFLSCYGVNLQIVQIPYFWGLVCACVCKSVISITIKQIVIEVPNLKILHLHHMKMLLDTSNMKIKTNNQYKEARKRIRIH